MKLCRKRRGLQLKRWAQREREYNLKRKEASHEPEQSDTARINFEPAVMLLEAAARNDIDEVRRLLRLNVTPDSTNEDGLTALHQCCIDDSEEMMKVNKSSQNLVFTLGTVNTLDRNSKSLA